MQHTLDNLANLMLDAVLVALIDGKTRRYVHANPAAQTLFGHSVREFADLKPTDLIVLKYTPDLFDRTRKRIENGEKIQEEFVLRDKAGREFWANVQTYRLDETKEGLFEISVIRDLSQSKALEARLSTATKTVDTLERQLEETQEEAKLAKRRLLAAIQTLPDALVIYDQDDRMVVCNEAYKQMYRESADAMTPGTPFVDILKAGLARGQYIDAIGREESWLKERLEKHRNPGDPVEQRLADDRYVRVFERITEHGDTVGCRVDVSALKLAEIELRNRTAELEELNEKMRGFALHDALTDLPNRRFLEMRLDALKDESGDRMIGALHIDLDNFKQINDRLGHAAGDEALIFAAKALKTVVRQGDSVFRTGGDEFVMIVEGDVTRALLVGIGERIIDALSEPFLIEQQSCRIGGSVGVAMQQLSNLSPEELLATSDMALYDAKRRGRGQVRVFSVDLKRKMRRQQRLADDLLNGIEAGQFFPVYQPQIDARTRALIGVETLCRWDHPARGIVAPDEFLPIARDLAVMQSIDQQIYDAALRDMGHLSALGLKVPKVSFNVELERLMSKELLPALRRIAACGISVAVELLESLSLDNRDAPAIWAIDALREGGISVEIDDFGSCRASLLGVLNVRPDVMKLDRALVNSVIDRRDQRDIIRALVNLANTLGIRVTAEGVESDVHGEMLTSLGCHVLQGYAIARPMGIDDLEMYLRSLNLAERRALMSLPVAAQDTSLPSDPRFRSGDPPPYGDAPSQIKGAPP